MSFQSKKIFANDVLSALPSDDYQRLLPNLRPVAFALGQVICETGERLESIYFPTTCVISLVYTTVAGSTAEIGMIGRDGILGLALLFGSETMPHGAVAQIGGEAIAIKPKIMQNEFSRSASVRGVFLRYTQALLTQISQTAVCNRLHHMEQRLCRWLLLCQDRTDSEDLRMTQEFISQMLGGRRESVTVAAGRLQDAGLIQYARGRVRILDRRGLEHAACECYAVVKDECNRLRGALKKMEPAYATQTQSGEVASAIG